MLAEQVLDRRVAEQHVPERHGDFANAVRRDFPFVVAVLDPEARRRPLPCAVVLMFADRISIRLAVRTPAILWKQPAVATGFRVKTR